MNALPQLWIRHETRETERRTPVAPADAEVLVRSGVAVTVEQSPQRSFPIEDYAAAGCQIAAAGSWPQAPEDTFVVGLKELPDEPVELRHRHVFFGHAYKGQTGAERLLRRFAAGGGALLDIEYLTDDTGRRLAAFGYWAGYLGAALAILHYRGQLSAPLRSGTRDELDERLRATAGQGEPQVLVIGALGRSGRGACDALAVAGVPTTPWDQAETATLDRSALLAHQLMVNTVLVTSPVPPFLTTADLAAANRQLRVVCDVSCDVGSPFNVLPVYDQLTSWQQPARRLTDARPPLDLIAIDNLPALLPEPASRDFSAELAPQLSQLGGDSAAWRRCLARFEQASSQLFGEVTDG